MKSRFVVVSSLLTLAACSGGGDDGSGTTTAGAANTTAGTGNANAGTNNGGGTGGTGTAGASTGGVQNVAGTGGNAPAGGNAGANVGGANPGGAGGTDPGGAGGMSAGGGGAGGAAGGGGNIPTTCGMPVASPAPANTCRNAPPPTLKLTELAGTDALFAPMMMVSPPGDNSRMFIATRDGIVHVYKDGALLPTPFLDITDLVPGNNGENEFGLLGIAFDPAFATSRKVYLEYISDTSPMQSHTATVLASEANPDVADETTLDPDFIVINQPQGRDNHKGGMINFGLDGCLYISFGDGGSQNDPDDFGQDTSEPMASILRVDPVTGMAAPGNPAFGDPRIWVYGLRNPWRTSFDRLTGDFYIGDVGQGAYEEVNVVPAGGGDLNFGWNVAEGPDGDQTGKVLPAKAHGRGDGSSITGGYVYRGTAIPDLVGRYLYGDFKSSNYWVLTYSGETGGQPTICDEYEITDFNVNGPAAFAEDNAGELYVLTLDGPIYKIEAGP
jgi:glucose/arabinose dehydrogenase